MKNLKDTDQELINHWYIIALASEVPDNKPISRTVYDVPYVLFKDEKGLIQVFVDQCVHRGAQLSLGKCESGQIRCPYHGWKFGSGGHVTEIPSEGPGAEAKNWKLKSVPFQIHQNCVWIWPGNLDHQNQSQQPWSFPKFDDPEFASYFMITDFENEVTHLVQNFMDVPHTVFVHDKWFRKRKSLKVPILLEAFDAKVKVTYQQSSDSIGFFDFILNPKKKAMTHTDEYIFPNLTRVDYAFGDHQFIINSQCTPVGRYKTRVFTWISFKVGILTKVLKPMMQFYTRQVITQDVEIMQNQGRQLMAFEKIQGPIEFNKSQGFHSTQADELHLLIDKMRYQGQIDLKSPHSLQVNRQREFWI